MDIVPDAGVRQAGPPAWRQYFSRFVGFFIISGLLRWSQLDPNSDYAVLLAVRYGAGSAYVYCVVLWYFDSVSRMDIVPDAGVRQGLPDWRFYFWRGVIFFIIRVLYRWSQLDPNRDYEMLVAMTSGALTATIYWRCLSLFGALRRWYQR